MPAPDTLEWTLPSSRIALLVHDGTMVTSHLAQALVEKTWRVVILCFPGQAVPSVGDSVQLGTDDPELIASTLHAVTEKYGEIGAFIYLQPHTDTLFDTRERAMIKSVFFMAKHLKVPLTTLSQTGRGCFMVVTRLDGSLGLAPDGTYGAIGSGLTGLVKTLALEWPDVFCRALDIDPAVDDAQAAQFILLELADPNRLVVEVGYGLRGRITLSCEDR